jgi:hypothetical protein
LGVDAGQVRTVLTGSGRAEGQASQAPG